MQLPNPMTQDYAQDFKRVKEEGAVNSTTRTQEETNIALMWAYDGAYKIGTPIRLFNRVRVLACKVVTRALCTTWHISLLYRSCVSLKESVAGMWST